MTYFICHGPRLRQILKGMALYSQSYKVPNACTEWNEKHRSWFEEEQPRLIRKKRRGRKSTGLVFSISTGSTNNFPNSPPETVHLVQPVRILVTSVEAVLNPCSNDKGNFTMDMIESVWQMRGFIKTKEGFEIVSLLYDTERRKGHLHLTQRE